MVPRDKGGKSNWINCVVACLRCNSRKSNKLLWEAGMTLLKKPKEPKWRPAFVLPLFKKRESWDQFVSEAYWDIELDE